MLIILLRSGWFTLLERKVLSYTQIRVGPNKVALRGIIIPIVDFLKLIGKNNFINMNNMLLYSICMKIWIRLILLSFCKTYRYICNYYIIFYIILIRSLIGYAILLPSLTTKRLYSILGIIRIFVILLRFEIRLFLVIVFLSYINLRTNIISNTTIRIFSIPIIGLLSVLVFVIEINRHPFEVIEGESELVSGFNVELSSIIFIVFFLREMVNIIVIIIIICYIFNMIPLYIVLIILILLIRSRYPRIRYDYIIIFQWTTVYFMIISLNYLC